MAPRNDERKNGISVTGSNIPRSGMSVRAWNQASATPTMEEKNAVPNAMINVFHIAERIFGWVNVYT